MMHVIVGSDPTARAKTRHTLAKGAAEELSWNTMTLGEIAAYASTSSLMGDTHVYLLSGALNDPEIGSELIALSHQFVGSVHTFIFEEEKLLKAPTVQLERNKVHLVVLEQPKKEENVNVFAIAGALGVRDNKKLWLSVVNAQKAGVAPEQIAGMLHWKVRDLISKKSISPYTTVQLHKLSRDIVRLYHDSHRGAGDLALLLERSALTL